MTPCQTKPFFSLAQQGSTSVELICGLTLSLTTVGFIAWSLWTQTLQVYLKGLSQETAQLVALRLPGTPQMEMSRWIETIKKDLIDQITSFPATRVFRSQIKGVRLHIDPDFENSAVLVMFYVCRRKMGMFFSERPESHSPSLERDCLGQFTGLKSTSNNRSSPKEETSDQLWMSVRSIFPHPHALKIYQSGLTDLPDAHRRQVLHQQLTDQRLVFRKSLRSDFTGAGR